MKRRTRIWMALGPLAAGTLLLALVAVPAFASAVGSATSSLVGGHADHDGNELALTPTSGSLTPDAAGTVEWNVVGGVLSGSLNVHNLPAAGSRLAYVFWYVNTSSGDKAFLGPIVADGSGTILFQVSGNGHGTFTATSYTTGPDAGAAIGVAPAGDNLFILLVENAINFSSPSPIGTAVSATF